MVYDQTSTSATFDPWPAWTRVVTYTTSASTTSCTWVDPWPLWTGATTTSITGGSAVNIPRIWTIWNDCTMTSRELLGHGYHIERAREVVSNRQIREPTAEDLQARLRQEQEYRARADARLLEEKQAREKAEALLREFLSAEQVESLEKRNAFQLESISKDGARKRYEIQRGRQGNVFLLNQKGERVEKYCIHPSEFVPDADTMLTQKLLIEGNEELFLRTANRTRLAIG